MNFSARAHCLGATPFIHHIPRGTAGGNIIVERNRGQPLFDETKPYWLKKI
jgi:hypothetical protein